MAKNWETVLHEHRFKSKEKLTFLLDNTPLRTDYHCGKYIKLEITVLICTKHVDI